MKLQLLVASVAALSLVACGEKADKPAEEVAKSEAVLETVDQRLSYMVGHNMAQQFKRDEVALDMALFTSGFEDATQGKESRLTQEQVQETISKLQERAQKRQAELAAEREKELAAQGEKNKAEGEAFLAENAKKEGVTTTESGLQYKKLVEGKGSDKPSPEDTVSVHYKGTLIDGTEFDSSYSRNEPATFPVGGVIPGWTEALQLMSVGDKFQLFIPSDLAYGLGGTGGAIGPNATLLFEVELLEVVKSEAEDKKAQ